MKEILTQGSIFLKDHYHFEYHIADIDYLEYENGEYQYTFYIDYPVIELLDNSLFQGIPGLDLDLKYPSYIRKNKTPIFIEERTPGEARENLYDLLNEVHMKSLNRLEWLIRTDTKYSGDDFYVKRKEEKKEIKVKSMFDLVSRSDALIKKLLEIICKGEDFFSQEIHINNDNRKDYYDLLMPLYIKQYELKRKQIHQGISKAKKEKIYKGRKRKEVDPYLFNQVSRDYLNHKLTLRDALATLNISKSTFFRRLKSLSK